MWDKNLLSVIIPAYNIDEYVGKCLESILAQTYTNLEVIIINDGSTDKTAEIIDHYALKDSRIIAIHKKNEGVSVARNTGIEKATGEYYFFFDGDDFMEANTIEEIYHLANENHVDSVIYGYYRYQNNKVIESCLPRFEKNLYQNQELIDELIPAFIGLSDKKINGFLNGLEGSLYVENPALWRIMIKGQIVRDNKLLFQPGLKVGEDTIYISRYLSYSKSCYIQQKCYYYLVTRITSTIYLYERNPEAKLEGKINLLSARKELTEDIMNRTGKNIFDYWCGTVVMSAIELAFLFSNINAKQSLIKNYHLWKNYLQEEIVKECIHKFQFENKKLSIKKIPFILLKIHLAPILFCLTVILNIIGFRFERN